MFIVDGVVVNYKDSNSGHAKFIKEKISEIKKNYKYPIKIKDRFGLRLNASGVAEPDKVQSLPLTHTIINKEGFPETWKYVKNPKKDARGEIIKERVKIEGKLFIQERDAELAFYLIYISPYIRTGKLIIEDIAKEAKETVKAKAKMIATRYLLYDEESPIYHEEKLLRTIALSFGVANANDNSLYTIEQVKLALENAIESGEIANDEERNEKAFKRALEYDDKLKQKAFIQEAVDKGILEFKEGTNTWAILSKEGVVVEKLLTVGDFEYNRRYARLAEHLSVHIAHKTMLETLLGKEGAFDEEVIDEKWVNNATNRELKTAAQRYGIKVFQKSSEQLRTEILEKIKE